mmetsp:Transcript_35371/g.64872  ORF Transcript_35371/g.64872 Transcript_35371/m.64872 type:complete len:81 (+) Transcript_35371:2393-2635(+)
MSSVYSILVWALARSTSTSTSAPAYSFDAPSSNVSPSSSSVAMIVVVVFFQYLSEIVALFVVGGYEREDGPENNQTTMSQ